MTVDPRTQLEIKRAVLDDASQVSQFQELTGTDRTPKALFTLSLNPEHTDRTIWPIIDAWYGSTAWYFDGSIQFWYLNRLQLEFPMQTANAGAAFTNRVFVTRFATYNFAAGIVELAGQQPALRFMRTGIATPLMAAALALRIRADRLDFRSNEYAIAGGSTMLVGAAVLSQYP